MDRFLEDQLRRIQELTRKVSGLERRSAEVSEEIERKREAMHRDPLDVRDLRTLDRPVIGRTGDVSPRRRKRRG